MDEFEDLNSNLVPDCEDLPATDLDGDGFSPADGDCDDDSPSTYPGAQEVSNDGVDQDCNGVDTIRCYVDDDGDGYGAAIGYFNGNGPACAAGFAAPAGDCDDADIAVFPGAPEGCDGIDSDCDGDLLDGAPDADGDGLPDCAAGDDDDSAD